MYKVSISQSLIKLPSYSQWETYYIGSLFHSYKLGRLICQNHYISLKRMGLISLVGLVLLLVIVSFSGLHCSLCHSPAFLSLGGLHLSSTDLWSKSSSCIIWSSSKFSNSLWTTWSCIISSSDVSFNKGCSNKSLTEGIVEISSSFCSSYLIKKKKKWNEYSPTPPPSRPPPKLPEIQ